MRCRVRRRSWRTARHLRLRSGPFHSATSRWTSLRTARYGDFNRTNRLDNRSTQRITRRPSTANCRPCRDFRLTCFADWSWCRTISSHRVQRTQRRNRSGQRKNSTRKLSHRKSLSCIRKCDSRFVKKQREYASASSHSQQASRRFDLVSIGSELRSLHPSHFKQASCRSVPTSR
jgi:hypothetical protein